MVGEIRAAGAELLAIAPQTLEFNARVIEQRKLGFDILRDPANALAARLGLRHTLPEPLRAVYQGFGIDLAEVNGEPSWTLPMPARYVIDQQCVIRYARVHPDYTRRPEVEETLVALSAVVGG